MKDSEGVITLMLTIQLNYVAVTAMIPTIEERNMNDQ